MKPLSWDETFMQLCWLISRRSKDPNTKVGAVITGQNNIILSVGYNGFPRGCPDDEFPWNRGSETSSESKYMYVVHAEQNAILNSKADLRGATLYVTMFPCNECAKSIIQKGITKVVYQENPYEGTESVKASIRMLRSARVTVTRYEPQYKLTLEEI